MEGNTLGRRGVAFSSGPWSRRDDKAWLANLRRREKMLVGDISMFEFREKRKEGKERKGKIENEEGEVKRNKKRRSKENG